MSEIVERLRDLDPAWSWGDWERLCTEAADEIEQMRNGHFKDWFFTEMESVSTVDHLVGLIVEWVDAEDAYGDDAALRVQLARRALRKVAGR